MLRDTSPQFCFAKRRRVVGMTGFEPATSSSRTTHSARLSYIPTGRVYETRRRAYVCQGTFREGGLDRRQAALIPANYLEHFNYFLSHWLKDKKHPSPLRIRHKKKVGALRQLHQGFSPAVAGPFRCLFVCAYHCHN